MTSVLGIFRAASSFVGRAHEVAELAALLSEARIVTLTGLVALARHVWRYRSPAEVLHSFAMARGWSSWPASVKDGRRRRGGDGVRRDARPDVDVLEALAVLRLKNCWWCSTTASTSGLGGRVGSALEATCPKGGSRASREGLGIAVNAWLRWRHWR